MTQTKYRQILLLKTTFKIGAIGPRTLHHLKCGNGTNRTILIALLRRPDQNNWKRNLEPFSPACIISQLSCPWGWCLLSIQGRNSLSKGGICNGSILRRFRSYNQTWGKTYEEGLNNVIYLNIELFDNIQVDNPTNWREKYSNFSSQLVDVRQDFEINYG